MIVVIVSCILVDCREVKYVNVGIDTQFFLKKSEYL